MPELEELLVNREELDRQLLAEVLLPFVGIDPARKEIVPKEAWSGLNAEGKILIVLLTRKAMYAMPEVGIGVEGLASKEVEVATGVKGGTLRPTLTRMKKKGLISQDGQKRYYIPGTSVLAVKSAVRGGSNG